MSSFHSRLGWLAMAAGISTLKEWPEILFVFLPRWRKANIWGFLWTSQLTKIFQTRRRTLEGFFKQLVHSHCAGFSGSWMGKHLNYWFWRCKQIVLIHFHSKSVQTEVYKSPIRVFLCYRSACHLKEVHPFWINWKRPHSMQSKRLFSC
jgi:hypothetical protein